MISVVDLDDSQLVTLKLEFGNYLQFQLETGAQCNVILVSLFNKATETQNCKGWVTFKLQFGMTTSNANWIVNPLTAMQSTPFGHEDHQIPNNDHINKPQTGSAPVYSLDKPNVSKPTHGPINREALIKNHPQVSSEGVGKLAGKYHIRIDSTIDPVQHALVAYP